MNFFTNIDLLEDFLTCNILSIASFKIGVPSILFFFSLYFGPVSWRNSEIAQKEQKQFEQKDKLNSKPNKCSKIQNSNLKLKIQFGFQT